MASQTVQLLQGMAETAVHCAEQTMLTAGQAVDSAALQRRLCAELEMVVPVLVHLLALHRLPTDNQDAEAAAAGCCVLLSTALAQGLAHTIACVRSATLAVTVKLGQALCTAGSAGGSVLFAGCLSACGGAVLQALLHVDATETDVQHGVAFYLLACRAVQQAAYRTTLCSAIVPALIVLIGRGNGKGGGSTQPQVKAVSALAGKLCLSLAKDASLAADFKVQVGRLTPDFRATLEEGLRAAMSGGASPAGTPKSRVGSTGSSRSGATSTPRRGAKPAIALKMDF